MSDIGERLREERERLGLVQAALAERCGVKKNAQSNYERGDRSPDAEFLYMASGAGVDVLYVITGQRAVGAVAADEAALIEAYRSAPEAVRKAVLAALLAGQAPGTFIVHGDVGAQASGHVTISGPLIKKK